MAGTVIKAVDMQDGEVVALKCSSFVNAIRAEAGILGVAKHPSEWSRRAQPFGG
jgi:hypothetical protein